MLEEAHVVEDAGAFSLLLEAIPMGLAKRITGEVAIPTIGIGAGLYCDGQVLVLHDVLGLFPAMTQIKPGVMFAGKDPVATDAVATAAMGFDPTSDYLEAPFLHGENHLNIAAQLGLGTNR